MLARRERQRATRASTPSPLGGRVAPFGSREERKIMDRDARDERHDQAQRDPAERPKRAWRTPEIVDVGDVGELTEAVSENVNDGQAGSMMVTYRP
jgi:hypothetical protein